MSENRTVPAQKPPLTEHSPLVRLVLVGITGLAMIGGALVGFVVTLAIVVAKARARQFIFAMEDLVAFRWELLPILAGLIGGFRLGLKRPRALPWVTTASLGGLFIGVAVGPLVGALLWPDEAGKWAGGVICGAIGLVAAALTSLRIRRIPRRPLITATFSLALLLGLAGFGLFGVTNLIDIDPLEFPEPPRVPVPEPSQVDAVVFLLGDGGALNDRSPLARAIAADIERWSDTLKRDSAVSVIYPGDVVYPSGVRPRDHPGFPQDSARLWAQINLVGGPAATRHATVGFFVTGNHDWGNHSGDAGFDRVLNLGQQLRNARQAGRFVSLLPAAGDPGPAFRDLRRNVRIVFFDTHWFLQERSREQRARFFERLSGALTGSGDREVILVAHHPYQSAGPHGAIIPGYHTLGIAYLLKEAGAMVQDLNSPPYDELLAGLRRTFAEARKPPLIYVGGHDHSLQVLTGATASDPRFVLVSGAASKVSSIQAGPGLVWGGEVPGYMMLVFRKDDGVDLFVVGGDKARLTCAGSEEEIAQCMSEGTNAFEIVYSATLLGPAREPGSIDEVVTDTVLPGTPWWTDETVVSAAPIQEDGDSAQPAPVAVPTRALLEGIDSVTTAPGRTYPAGTLKRMFAGDLNRHLWGVPVTLPVLDLDKVGGGLAPTETFGGQQTVGLRFLGRDGLEYDFRPVVKHGDPPIPKLLPRKLSMGVVDDQMGAMFPFGGIAAAELSAAVGIVEPQPLPVVMPNDERLGQFRPAFAGRVGMLTVRPDERQDGRPGIGGYTSIIDSDSLDVVLRTDPNSIVDERWFLRARLIDVLVGDWDRHSGQWRWGMRERGDSTIWRAIPKDRDWAFSTIDGLVARLARVFMPRYVGFSEELPAAKRLVVRNDYRRFSRLERTGFLDVVQEVQSQLTDSVLAAAVTALPTEYQAGERERLLTGLRARRDGLGEFGRAFYRALARTVNVRGIDQAEDVVEFERISEERVRVTIRTRGAEAPPRYERLIDGRETRTVRLFIDATQDRVVGNEDLPFKVEIASDSTRSDE